MQLKEIQSTQLFSLKQINSLATYFAKGFLQNLASYQYVCTEIPTEYVEVRTLPVQTPLVPMPTKSSNEAIAAELARPTTSEDLGAGGVTN
jgi:hypothetical protein